MFDSLASKDAVLVNFVSKRQTNKVIAIEHLVSHSRFFMLEFHNDIDVGACWKHGTREMNIWHGTLQYSVRGALGALKPG